MMFFFYRRNRMQGQQTIIVSCMSTKPKNRLFLICSECFSHWKIISFNSRLVLFFHLQLKSCTCVDLEVFLHVRKYHFTWLQEKFMSWLLSKSVSFVQTVYRIINTSYYIKFKTDLRYEIFITVIGPSRVQFGL